MEYIGLLILIMSALMIFSNYIVRGFAGRLKSTGDSFGAERQYDPRPYGEHGEDGGTLRCVYHRDTGEWLDADCYDACMPDLTPVCIVACSHSDCD